MKRLLMDLFHSIKKAQNFPLKFKYQIPAIHLQYILFLNGIIIVDEPEQSFIPAARANTLRRRCTALRASRETNPQTQLAIFPKSHIEGGWGAYVRRDEIEKTKRLTAWCAPNNASSNILYRLSVYLYPRPAFDCTIIFNDE